ncbi:MAG: hypothetical protein J0I81_13465, partial [Hyphomicrobium sp.]|nr:hypothetical protein [Hyphomicrobium sp.]
SKRRAGIRYGNTALEKKLFQARVNASGPGALGVWHVCREPHRYNRNGAFRRQPAAAIPLGDPFEQVITDCLFSRAARDKIVAGDRPAVAELDRDIRLAACDQSAGFL